MYTFSVILLVRVAKNMFDAKFYPVTAEDEREARLEALSDFLKAGGDTGDVARVKAHRMARVSKVPTLAGLQPV